ncbi:MULTISPECIES: PadR family transcriptional regulator [unclassified Fusibacter]|uniref:PadR family transcriptional regulator n=1 Tax=unclassified Fusibacter TaxID=2624464 RepID=UPI0010127F09|nr:MULTISPECIES: helix-turn-helix transcriptional regulator [unclassified Fusibacter]MCK8060373.1 helix-turn-helix transcriptional regulator [Fusibacter sp. A2]NPE20338.1 PadR family transcriptional regulator [Fusibacter sp. A1]RXV63544.1 PadR family transcriptional regulator [Fusibacter sp. A1]
MKLSKELVKGSTVLLVLNLLKNKPMYGYEMIKNMELISSGTFEWKEGTLYPILHGLEVDGMLDSFWETPENGRKRKYYQITKKGLKLLDQKQSEWKQFTTAMDVALGGMKWIKA